MPIGSRQLELFLHEHIPLRRSRGIQVIHCAEDGIRLRAPLPPNINHRQTAFGGSISAIAMTAGWSYVHRRLQSLEMPARIVVSNAETRFRQPVTDDFEAWCPAPHDKACVRFVAGFRMTGRARIQLRAWSLFEWQTAAIFDLEHVARRTVH